jgi:hypothetical protein
LCALIKYIIKDFKLLRQLYDKVESQSIISGISYALLRGLIVRIKIINKIFGGEVKQHLMCDYYYKFKIGFQWYAPLIHIL